MAALAYILLPVTGLLAFLLSSTPRTRSHGLQAIVLGTLWPLSLYAASAVAAILTWVVAVIGTLVWLGFTLFTAAGRDPKLPFLGEWLFETNGDASSSGG